MSPADIFSRLAALEAAVFGAGYVPAPVPAAGEPTDEQIAAVHAHLRGLGLEPHRTQSLDSGAVIGMLRATGGDPAQAAANFHADVVRFLSRGKANLAAQGVKNPSDAEILDAAAYLLWVGLHDQGKNALSMAQGFPDSLGEL